MNNVYFVFTFLAVVLGAKTSVRDTFRLEAIFQIKLLSILIVGTTI